MTNLNDFYKSQKIGRVEGHSQQVKGQTEFCPILKFQVCK